ncbi:MFS transporter [Methanobacterium formicicum]|jgi:EmrB/QacA subfamily drug resistance transporter|uniref:Transport protein n=1 Tax=Methanobacterium formicicum TaxID=2162 RepID=A0A0S4FQV2_METFO|nr:MFS transporter [Methanobacterium formicicum]CEL25425.1 transport protein [Methanobacterium formicicum]
MDYNGLKKDLLIVGILVSFLTPFVRSSINLAIPFLANEFTLSAVFLTWISTIYLLVNAILYIPFGRIGDIYGRKRIFQYGLIIFTVSSFISAFSTSGEMFLFFRVFQAIGNAMIFANLNAMISSAFPVNERGKAFGLTSMSVFVGLILGPILGGVITEMVGWRTLFYMDTVIGIIAAYAITRFKYDWIDAQGEKLDILGSFLLGISLIAILYGFSDFTSSYSLFLILAGIFGMSLFYLVEKRAAFPLINLDLFKIKRFTFGNITALLNYGAFVSVGFILTLYLQYLKGYSPITAGLIVSVQSVMMVLVSPFAGRLSDKIDPGSVSTMGMVLTTIGVALMTLITFENALYLGGLALIIFGSGIGLFYSSNTKMVMSAVDKRYYGVASATLSNMRSMGQIFGMGIVMIIISTVLGNVQITPSAYPELIVSLRSSLIAIAVLSAVGIFTSLFKD